MYIWQNASTTKQVKEVPATSRGLPHPKLPGQCVSVEQVELSTAGFIAQLKGRPTTKQYHAATIVVDHAS
jgi:hypothetical protein